MSKEIHDMPWKEFTQLLSGISPDTPLGRIVSIRSETDEDVLKNFTPEQRRIRSEWRKRIADSRDSAETENVIEMLKKAFISMAGGG